MPERAFILRETVLKTINKYSAVPTYKYYREYKLQREPELKIKESNCSLVSLLQTNKFMV